MTDLAELVHGLARIEGKLDELLARKAAPVSSSAAPVDTGAIAPDSDLDSQYGDPTLKKSPPRWEGRDLANKRYSQLTPEELECLIGFLVWKADKTASEGKPDAAKYAGYAIKDAARARGWLKRVREGKVKPAAAADPFDDNSLPF